MKKQHNTRGKDVYVYNLEGKYVGAFISAAHFERALLPQFDGTGLGTRKSMRYGHTRGGKYRVYREKLKRA